MSTSVGSPGSVRRPAAAARRRSYPGWWMSAAAAVAWLLIVTEAMADLMPAQQMSHHGGTHHGGHVMPEADGLSPLVSFGWHWALMVVAMMWPLYAETAAMIGRATFRRWRIATVGVFVAGTSLLWFIFGALARAVFEATRPVVPAWVWSLAWLAVALVATRSLWRARLLRRCAGVQVLAPRGRRALVTAAAAAARSWPRCALLCGPVMVAMVAGHQLPLMIGGTAAVWWEQRHPHAWRDPVPPLILAATALVVAGTYLWTGLST